MAEKLEVKRGEKIEDQAAALAGKELGILVSAPPDDGTVQGQAMYNDMTQCPYCGHIGFTRGLNSDFYIAVICGNCGRAFRA